MPCMIRLGARSILLASPLFSQNPAYRTKMNAEMIGHLSLSITVFLDRILNPLVPLLNNLKDSPTEEVLEAWPVEVSLALAIRTFQ
jgi:hypothetical protein